MNTIYRIENAVSFFSGNTAAPEKCEMNKDQLQSMPQKSAVSEIKCAISSGF